MSHKDGEHKKNKSDDLKKYYMLGLPLLGLMALIAVAGVVVTVAFDWFVK